MSIKQGFLTIAVTIILLLGLILYLMVLEVRNQGDLADAESRHYASYKLADELRQSSDDLTRMARTYAVTGDPIYEAYFQEILAIRNGEVPRPKGYDGIYWDFVTATGESAEPIGEPVALQELMRRAHFTEDEFGKLLESQQKSDALVALEERAMAAMQGLFLDAAGHYVLRGEPDQALARELLHGPAYHRAKASIMEPIDEFAAMVETRTTREMEVLRTRATVLVRAVFVLNTLTVGLLVLSFVLLQRRVIRPVGELATAAKLAESGDYGGRVSVAARDEIGQLASAFNQMSGAIEADIAARERSSEELAHAHAEAENANQAKSAFLANMSHELRTPMNAILGYSEMLMEDAEDEGNEDTAADLKKIQSAGKHLLALINDVLDLSKIESGNMELYVETLQIPALIDEIATTVDPLIKKNDNRLEVVLDPSLNEMCADLTKVRQTLFNLLSNAAKFTHAGVITLSVKPILNNGEEWVQISVSDSGIGIPPEKLDHVFAEFSQADDTTSRNYGGTGLGLSISRRFCEMMQGDLSVESTLGQGSTFTIRLPLDVKSLDVAVREETAAVTPPPGAERAVLVIDDDPNALDLLGRTLQGAGLQAVTASDGREALRLARSIQPVAITLDVMMPGMDGWEVLRELKADPLTRDIPVLMITMTDDRSLGYAMGATEFLTKPVERTQLIQLLARHTSGDSDRLALVVDDQEDNREVLRGALEKEGWEVHQAENGRVALDQVAEQAPSLILLDLMMPVMDGFEFVMEMRKLEAASSIPIVVVTAKDITDEDRRRLNGGVVGLIEKNGLAQDSLLALLREQVAATEQESTQ